MECPGCGSRRWKVVDTRARGTTQPHPNASHFRAPRVYRRRECRDCGFRGTTEERWAHEWAEKIADPADLVAIASFAQMILKLCQETTDDG